MKLVAALLALAPLQEPDLPGLVKAFLDGGDAESTCAREKIASLGHRAIPALSKARSDRKAFPRSDAFDDLLFDLKFAAAGEAGRSVLEKLRKIRITVDMENAPPSATVEYFREIAGLNILIDPALDVAPAAVTLKRSDVLLSKALDALGAAANLDYDVRWGVLFLSSPERLWTVAPEPAPRPLTEEQAKMARARLAELGSESPEARDRAAAELRKLGAAAIPVLEEGTRAADAETAARAKALVAELAPRPRRWKVLPDEGAWRTQTLAGGDLAIARRLDSIKIDLAFEDSKMDDILGFVRDFTELRFEMKAKPPARRLTVKFADLPLGRCLELILLPLGLDLRIENGAIQVVERN